MTITAQGIVNLAADEDELEYETPLRTAPLPLQEPRWQIATGEVDNQGEEEKEEKDKNGKGSLKGAAPSKFDGDHKKAKSFFKEFELYVFINRRNETFKIPADRVATALSFIKGDKVDHWKDQQADQLVERILRGRYRETDEVLWEDFKNNFFRAFTDTAEEEDALQQLENLKMKDGDLDTYAAKFERLVKDAGLEGEVKGLAHKFKDGLPDGLA